MRIIIIAILTFIFLINALKAQYLTVFNVDASDYPAVKAKFLAFDEEGKQIRNLTPADFSVTEDGIEREVTYLSCPTPKPPAALSSVLTIDVSGSMKRQRLEYAKAAARAWVNALPLGKSECAITSFNSSNYFNQDFTADKQKLLAAIENLSAGGGTDFDAGFIDPMAGALLAVEAGKHKKVVVFLTDGKANGSESAIIQKANRLNAVVYCVTLDMPCPQILKNISEQTSGQWFENVTTKEETETIYRTILHTAQGCEPCEIEWKSEALCSAGKRTVVVKLNSPSIEARASYMPPDAAFARLEIDPSGIGFGGVEPGSDKDSIITITAHNADFTVADIKSSNPWFSVSPGSFSLKAGESRDLTVTFSPQDSSFSFARFSVESAPCEIFLYASGGFMGKPPKQPTLKLIHPNGGEEFLAGSDTEITWEGVLPEDTVSLAYSVNSGNNWEKITDNATGLKYGWKVPDTPSNQCLMKVNLNTKAGRDSSIRTLTGHTANVSSVSWSPDGKRIVSGSKDNTIKIWDADNGALIRSIFGVNGVGSVRWSPDGKRIASGGENNTIKIWDANNGALIRTLFGHTDYVSSVRWSPNGGRIASGSTDNTVKIWDASSGALIKTLSGQMGDVRSVSWSPDGGRIAIGCWNDTIYIWDVSSGMEIRTLSGHIGDVYSVSWSQDGNRIVSGGWDRTIRIWDANSGAEIRTLYGHTNWVLSIDFSPYCDRIVSGSWDKTVRIWDAINGESIKTLYGHTGSLFSVSWSPDGSRIASSSTDRTIKIWDAGWFIQQDISDSLWSIVAPEAASRDIDLGRVLVGSSKDSVVTQFITNPGSFPNRIDSIFISGANADQFDIISGLPPFVLQPGESAPVEFRFKPGSAGIKTADIIIYTQADTILQTIRGEGVDIRLEVSSAIIDFEKVVVGNRKILTQAVLKNVGQSAVTIDSVLLMGPDKEQFNIISGNSPFALQPDEEKTMELQFSPEQTGRTNCDLGFYSNSAGSPALTQLYGEGIHCDETAFVFETFRDNPNFILLEGAKIENGIFRLTDAASPGDDVGAVWYAEKLPVRNGFDVRFSFKISDGANGAVNDGSEPGGNGFAFVIQNSGPDEIGEGTQSLGYSGIRNSIAIEFDLFKNEFDPNGNHIAFQSMATGENTAQHNAAATHLINQDIPEIKNGVVYHVKIDYNIAPKAFRVFLDEDEVFDEPFLIYEIFDLNGFLKLDCGKAYIGFTSSIGDAVQNHDILNLSVCPISLKTSAPNIISSGELEFCDGDSVILRVSDEFQSYRWSTGDTTRAITVKGSGTFTVVAEDSFGCKVESGETIVNVFSNMLDIESGSEENVFELDTTTIDRLNCRTMLMKNRSSKIVKLDDIAQFGNIEFSIPQSQFPIEIMPNDSFELLICFSPKAVGLRSDTIRIDDLCSNHRIRLIATGIENTLIGRTRCGIYVKIIQNNDRKNSVITVYDPFPNPFSTETILIFNLNYKQNVRIDLINAFGNRVKEIHNSALNPGLHDFIIESGNLTSGLYFYRIIGEKFVVSGKVIVRK